MSAKTDVNRRVLAIQAKKKRYKPGKRKGKGGSGLGPNANSTTANSSLATGSANVLATTTSSTSSQVDPEIFSNSPQSETKKAATATDDWVFNVKNNAER